MRKYIIFITLIITLIGASIFLIKSKINNEHSKIDQVYTLPYEVTSPEPFMDPSKGLLQSQLCTFSQFNTPIYNHWCKIMKEEPVMKRKQWEFVYILESLNERNLLKEGMKGLGFGVGTEPLPAVFASFGVNITATDIDPKSAEEKGWAQSNQYMTGAKELNSKGILRDEIFNKLVRTRIVDMNHIPEDLYNLYDFTWSACSLEHLGSIEKGLEFVLNSLKTLKPGGIAVHTTEFNLSSNNKTLYKGGTVIFRKKDIDKLVDMLHKEGHEIYVNYNPGSSEVDKYVDIPPYTGDAHLKLQIQKYVSTSIGLIIKKSAKPI
jgi:2-polyprenyl-3-methyl-5-hydroxy-6-metoxy-1,4-benzoquinol methylase